MPGRTGLIAVFAALAVAGCGSRGHSTTVSAAQARAALTGSPPALAALHAQAGRLLGGGTRAFGARLRRLRGYPIVVNKWASWCPPCQGEFGVFAQVSAAFGRQVAFLGVDSKDATASASSWLRSHPLSYPSYSDGDSLIASSIQAGFEWPQTVFIDRRGQIVYVKAGPYASAAALATDVRRYGLGGA